MLFIVSGNKKIPEVANFWKLSFLRRYNFDTLHADVEESNYNLFTPQQEENQWR